MVTVAGDATVYSKSCGVLTPDRNQLMVFYKKKYYEKSVQFVKHHM